MLKKVYCWGTFDIIHEGHVKFLRDSKKQGDYLGVIIVPDKAVLENKGQLPLKNQQQRAEQVRKINEVNEVITPIDFKDCFEVLLDIKPEVFVFGYDQNINFQNKLKEFLAKKSLNVEFYNSKKFAGGIHSSSLKNA